MDTIEPRKTILRRLNVSSTQAVVLSHFLQGFGTWRYWKSIKALMRKGLLALDSKGKLSLTTQGKLVAEELENNSNAFHQAFEETIRLRKQMQENQHE